MTLSQSQSGVALSLQMMVEAKIGLGDKATAIALGEAILSTECLSASQRQALETKLADLRRDDGSEAGARSPDVIRIGKDAYKIVQAVDAPTGPLLVLEDARLTSAAAQRLFKGCADPGMEAGDDEPGLAQLGKIKPALATLRQVDRNGRVIADTVIDPGSPTAVIHAERLGSNENPIFLVETNNDACAVGRTGHFTWFYQAQNGVVAPVQVKTPGGGTQEVHLARTLKSYSRLEPTTPPKILIHQAQGTLDPDSSDIKFVIHYISIRFDGARWTYREAHESTGSDLWEMDRDSDFPALAKFPD